MEGSQGTGPSQACDLEVKDNQEHLMVCEGYEDLRGDADLGNEKELVEFFNSVMGKSGTRRTGAAVQQHSLSAVAAG